MQFSIITVNYNNKIGLENTILSVINQTNKDFEHIVIDGNSTDGSKDVIDKHKDFFAYSLSEPDTGVYNAMNKGVKASKGAYLLFLNSGDTLFSNTVLEEALEKINNKHDIYYGNLVCKTDQRHKVQTFPKKLTFSFFYKNSLPHPATFIKKIVFDKVFYYNEDFKISSDWEFFICAICKYDASYKYLDLTISNFETNGISNQPENRVYILEERQSVFKKHFPLFIDDYEEAVKQTRILNSNRFKMLLELENSKVSKKINSLVLRILLKLFRNKKLKDL